MPPEGATLLVNGPTRARSDSSPNIKRIYGRGAGAGQSRIAGMLAIVVVPTALAAAVAKMSTGASAPPVYHLISTPTPPTPPTPLIPNDHGYARVLSGIKAGERVIVQQAIQVNALWHEAHGESS